MQRGFPLELLSVIRCPVEAAALRIEHQLGSFVSNGTVRCENCGAKYAIADGILSLLGPERLHPESAREMTLRDQKNAAILSGSQAEWTSRLMDAIEVGPTLEALASGPGMSVLELGCGPGRYTLNLASQASAVVAVDFSRPGLQILRRKLAADANVALVQADVTKPYAAADQFDRVISTLHSNLPDAQHRMACLGQVALGLKRNGRAIISMHHFSGRDRALGVPASGRYPDSGIFRYYMSRAEAIRESAPFFSRVHFVHINAAVPGLPSVGAARIAARLPLVRSALARLFLAIAEQPRADNVAGHVDPVPSIGLNMRMTS